MKFLIHCNANPFVSFYKRMHSPPPNIDYLLEILIKRKNESIKSLIKFTGTGI